MGQTGDESDSAGPLAQGAPLDAFAAWAASLDLADVPDDVLARVRLQVASSVAAARAAAETDFLADGAAGTGGDATVVTGGTADAYTAAFTNAAASTVHDYDDYLFMGHTGHSAVFASLAACERAGLGTEPFLENVVVANELAGRLGAAVAVGPHNGQMWAFLHQAAAAGVAANTRGDESDVREAVRLALYNPDYPLEAGFIDGDSKALTAAKPTAAGLRVGDAAVAGATGSPAAFADFCDSYAYLPFPEMVDGFGDAWVSRTLCFKPRPGCAYVQAPLECLAELTDRGLDPDAIEQVTVTVPLLSVAMEGLSRPYRTDARLLPVNVTFSVVYSLALQLVAGAVTPDRLTQGYIDDHREEIEAMAAKIDVEHDWGMTADVLAGLGAGLDFSPLVRDRGLLETARGLRQLGDAHSSVDTRREAAALLRSGEVRSVLGAVRSPLSWETFDLARADFEALVFNFGAAVDVETASGHYRAEASEHAGACGRPLAAVTETVRKKFEREVGDGFETVSTAEDHSLSELAAFL